MRVDAQWFKVTAPVTPAPLTTTSYLVLVVAGRVVTAGPALTHGEPWAKERAYLEHLGYKVTPAPEVPTDG